MDKLSLSSSSSPSISCPFLSPLLPFNRATTRRVSFNLNNPKKFSVFASQSDANDDNQKLNQWDLMELKFGKMLGEDPKLTVAKIMGRKVNPDASYMEIEKNFYKNNGKMVEVKEVPFDIHAKPGPKKATTNGLNLAKPASSKATNGLNLVKPVPKKGIIVGGGEHNSKLPDIKRPKESIENKMRGATKSNVPNVILRKPSVFDEKDDEVNNSSKFKIKPNLSLSMRTEPVKEKFSGMTLLKKPELSEENEDGGRNENNSTDGSVYSEMINKPANRFESDMADEGQRPTISSGEVMLLEKPNSVASQNSEEIASDSMPNEMDGLLENHSEGSVNSEGDLILRQDGLRVRETATGMQHPEQTDVGYLGNEIETSNSSSVAQTGSELSVESALIGKPKRLDQSVKRTVSYPTQEGNASTFTESFNGDGMHKELPQSEHLEETEEIAWAQVEQLSNLGERVDVELISCSPRGFVASYGLLIGFLPYRNLAAKWKFLAFESWLRKNGLDPSKYRQHLGIVGNEEAPTKNSSLESLSVTEISQKENLEISADMELEDLLKIYDQEKIKYLSSYIGQRIKVNILLADRKSRKLIFSMRPKEKEETVSKKRSLMKKLSVGDVVKCYIKKITYFGIFVEVEGVSALIHQTEVSWDGPLDPFLKIGQMLEAKVHQLDFALERIFLSLKEITPDPLNEALECIVGSNGCSGESNFALADSEWAEADSLVKELQAIDGVQTVTKGRFFLSPGMAPTFQVYMASMFENQYKLLARSGNKVQELMVEASLDKDEMKAAVLQCTNNVELEL